MHPWNHFRAEINTSILTTAGIQMQTSTGEIFTRDQGNALTVLLENRSLSTIMCVHAYCSHDKDLS